MLRVIMYICQDITFGTYCAYGGIPHMARTGVKEKRKMKKTAYSVEKQSGVPLYERRCM